MAGTILCGVTDAPEGRDAARLADALSAQLGLRLVLAHVVDGIPVGAEESLTALQGRKGGERLLTAITGELRPDQEPELRLAHGDPAERLAQFAAEEGADLIVVVPGHTGCSAASSAAHSRASSRRRPRSRC